MALTLFRNAAHSIRPAHIIRTLSSASSVRKDFVQDLYLRELKAYKPPPAVKDAHVGNVKEIKIPLAPTPPSLPSDLSAELSAYDKSQPALANDTISAAATSSIDAPSGADAFLAFLEQDPPKEEAHH
ncbi:ATP synthase complex subunit H-domain-containing protein [Cantharellus anzutake]|uniref:ATP synthase complex subunit H-domain-containing protein n=1 Tax=Cantharellus anzutake TaxID=1750568 RepID=UPI0019072F10|nr:ATP synthase complex subunit H-domain-containing protein [Cantharellus anzutake]KAF8335859.1 ATP synthase complex subunit H-domain-containing protein [Cantharellus anzutake]